MNYIVRSYILKNIFPALVAGLATGAFNYYFIQSERVAFFAGMAMGILIFISLFAYSTFIHKKLVRNVPIYLDVLINTFVIIITILFWAFLLLLILNAKNWSDIIPYLRLFFNSQGVAIGVTYGIIVSFLFNLFISVQEIIGSRTMAALFLGIYSQPREENRIFMFLDIKSSTTLAEKLGNKQFLNLLNDFFFFASEAISQTKGSIYKYVGDEIIISWPEKKGVKHGNALRCFFLIDDAISRKKTFFMKKYGVVPEFKAGMHAGQVVAGEIGFKKKEITYLGDVLNTTARIEGICNDFNKRFLVSHELKKRFDSTDLFVFQEVDEINLRGKQTATKIFTASLSDTYNKKV